MRQLKITKNITDRHESLSLDKYLSEISKEELISVMEEVQLAQRIRQGDQQALEKLTKANLRFVVSVAKQYQYQWLSLPDLINEGNIWLIKAAQKFDETRGFKFISYAVRWIRQSVLQALWQVDIVRLPFNQISQRSKINKAKGKFEQEYDREPTTEELMDVFEQLDIDLSENQIDFHENNKINTVSLSAPVWDGDMTTWDTFENDSPPPDNGLINEWLKHEIAFVLNTLNPREKDVVKYYFWLNGRQELTLDEIGDKFWLTRERVRQIKEKAIRRLKRTNKSKHLKQYLGK